MMAFVYRYVDAADGVPPAPFVLVNLSNLNGTATAVDRPAKVDSGADRTVLPESLAVQLGLEEVERLTFEGLGGQRLELPTYQLQLVVRDLAPIVVKVAASDGEPHVLLGRDVLNRYKIVLDGPNLKLEIG
jgi:hypothetical protein